MGNTTTTSYMNLTLPVPTVEIGPAWATELITALNAIDAHDHTNGKGKLIPTAAINVNANLNFLSFSASNLLSTQFTTQTSPLIGLTNSASIYVVNGDLYYTNGSGTSVQLTSGSFLAPAPGTVNSLGLLTIAGNLVIAPSSTYSLISVDTSIPRTITLPAVSLVNGGRLFAIKDASGLSFSNPITILPNGADTVEEAASYTIQSGDGCTWFAANGSSNWEII